MVVRLSLTNDPKVQKILQECANQKLMVLLKQQHENQQHFTQPGYIFEVEIQIRHSWQSILEFRRRQRRLQRAADSADVSSAAADSADVSSAAADSAGCGNAAADLNAASTDDNEFKAEDNADAENIGRMAQQNLTPRPLIVTAKCVCVSVESSSSSSSSSVNLSATVASMTSRFATDAEMARAAEDGQVLAVAAAAATTATAAAAAAV